ncbi:unnamed protein product [Symbiodinium microadriaticum]|nr:unnamed protein product [Symbiodinium microadriaticum]
MTHRAGTTPKRDDRSKQDLQRLTGVVIHRRVYPDSMWLSIVGEAPGASCHEICYPEGGSLPVRDLWRGVKLGDCIEATGCWKQKGFCGHCLEATSVVVESMRLWSIERCLTLRSALFQPQRPRPEGVPHLAPRRAPAVANCSQDVHGGPNTLERAQAVAKLLLRVAGGKDSLNQGTGVLDVAGGTGLLSLALALCGVHATVVDPRRSAGCLPSRARKMMWKSGVGPLMSACRAWFGGRLQGADDSFSGSGDAVPPCEVP